MKNYTKNSLISLIFTANRLIRERTAGHGKIDPFSLLQFRVLGFVDEKVAPTMKDIANYLYITSPSATSIINRLVKARELERSFDKDDRRVVRLKLTEIGRKTYERQRENSAVKMNKIIEPLDQEEINNFARILTKIIDTK